MSKEEDKLVEIQGIAQLVGQVLQDQLIAGLWRSCMLEKLCWFKHMSKNKNTASRPTKWRAPSWSWASSNDTIWISTVTKFHGDHLQKQIWAKIENLDVRTKPSGELECAPMSVRCKPIYACITPNLNDRYRTIHQFHGTLTFTRRKVEVQVGLSGNDFVFHTDDPELERTHYVYMMVIQRCPHDALAGLSGIEGDCIEGLLLVPQYEYANSFMRVGIFQASGTCAVEKVVEEYEAVEEEIITLV
jgi:hypothetical protein